MDDRDFMREFLLGWLEELVDEAEAGRDLEQQQQQRGGVFAVRTDDEHVDDEHVQGDINPHSRSTVENGANSNETPLVSMQMSMQMSMTSIVPMLPENHGVLAMMERHRPHWILDRHDHDHEGSISGPACRFEFAQIQVTQQPPDNGSCGHYAIYNGKVAFQMCLQRDPLRFVQVLDKLNCRGNFWRTYHHNITLLEQNARKLGNASWPWSVKEIRKGIMERSYMQFLERSPNAYFPTGFSATLQFGYNIIISTPQNLLALHDAIQRCKTQPGHVQIFFLGLLSHWATMVVNNHRGSIELLFFDSKNHVLRGETSESAERWLEKYLREREMQQKKPLPPYRIEVIKQTRLDIAACLHIFIDCLAGDTSILTVSLDSHVNRVLDSFQEAMFSDDGEEKDNAASTSFAHLEQRMAADPDLYIAKLLEWLLTQWPPAMLRDCLLEDMRVVGVRWLSPLVSSRLRAWSESLLRFLAQTPLSDCHRFGDDVALDLQKFGGVLDEMLSHLQL